MKKLMVIALAVAVGGIAFASSLSVPWFIDLGPVANKLPPLNDGSVGLVYLHNNLSEQVTCSIEYFTAAGNSVGPAAPNNTFVIAPKASIGFRPVASDPNSAPGGQENVDAGWLVPDRPLDTTIPGNDGKGNGSLVVTWLGGPNDVQGVYTYQQTITRSGEPRMISFGHLLPPGV